MNRGVALGQNDRKKSCYFSLIRFFVNFAVNEKKLGVFHSVVLHDGSLGAAMAKDGDAWRF